jgi:integrase
MEEARGRADTDRLRREQACVGFLFRCYSNPDAYMHAAGLFEAKGTPLFRSADWHGGALTHLPMHRVDVWRMIRRRAAAAGIDADMCCHTFRATGLTNFLANGGTLENAQAMADHASPRTTQLYDRTGDEVTLDEVERIAI